MDPALSIRDDVTQVGEQLVTNPSRSGVEDLTVPDGLWNQGAGTSVVRWAWGGLAPSGAQRCRKPNGAAGGRRG